MTCCTASAPARRAFLAAALGAIAAACAGPTTAASARREQELLRQGAASIGSTPVVDLHAHPGRFPRVDARELPMTALTEMREAGVHAAFFAAVGDGPVIQREATGIRNFRDPTAGELHRSTLGQLERVRARARAGDVGLVLEAGDLSRHASARRVAALLAIEGGDPLEGDPARVRAMHELGVRSIQLVHYRINELGDIQTAPARHGGLTQAGHDVVAEMNRLRMIVDAAHAAPATLRAILAASRTPVVVSHTGPAALRPGVARHLPDDLLRAIAARDGVIGVWPLVRQRPASLDRLLADVRHVRQVAGLDHTALATDMTGMSTQTSILTYQEFAAVPAALLASGFTEAETRKLLGGNVLRVVDAVLKGDPA